MDQREQTRGGSISDINENNWGKLVANRKTTEFPDIQLAVSIRAHNATAHNQNTSRIGCSDELPKIVFSALPMWRFIDSKNRAHIRNHISNAGGTIKLSHKGKRR